ncbi:hypothetical protein [Pedobacter glucosidilyticus]|uniref:hypothetical protein n=1 Tax=Pedobacter glucosidilyticus TaxID=1122941 RepID=UPI0012DD64D7|nr:hypothetical protein [Pedobacter glucosidilyticus]
MNEILSSKNQISHPKFGCTKAKSEKAQSLYHHIEIDVSSFISLILDTRKLNGVNHREHNVHRGLL